MPSTSRCGSSEVPRSVESRTGPSESDCVSGRRNDTVSVLAYARAAKPSTSQRIARDKRGSINRSLALSDVGSSFWLAGVVQGASPAASVVDVPAVPAVCRFAPLPVAARDRVRAALCACRVPSTAIRASLRATAARVQPRLHLSSAPRHPSVRFQPQDRALAPRYDVGGSAARAPPDVGLQRPSSLGGARSVLARQPLERPGTTSRSCQPPRTVSPWSQLARRFCRTSLQPRRIAGRKRGLPR